MTYSYNPLASLGLDKSIPLDGSGKIPSDYLPSYVDDVVEYDDLASFPGTGETGKIYVAKDTGYTYRWTGSVYVRIGSGGEVELNLGSQGSPSLYFTGDPNTGIYSPGADQVAISTNGAGRLFVDNLGNVGINTPAGGATGLGTGFVKAKSPTGAPGFFLENSTGTNWWGVYGGTSLADSTAVVYPDGGYLRLATTTGPSVAGFSEKLRITSAGLVGIGTSTPDALFKAVAGDSTTYSSSGSTAWPISSSSAALTVQNSSGTANTGSYVGLAAGGGLAYIGAINAGATIANIVIGQRTGSATYSERIRIDSSGRVGIGTTGPQHGLSLLQGNALGWVSGAGNAKQKIEATATDGLEFYTGATPTLKATLDSSGRLLVGTSSSSDAATTVLQGASDGATGRSVLWMKRGQAAASISSGTGLGIIRFGSSDSGLSAQIAAESDGAWSSTSDCPGSLVFSVTADGASSPTERMRINNAGTIYTLVSAAFGNYFATTQAAGTSATVLRGVHSATQNSVDGTVSFQVFSNGNVQNTNNSYTAISDIKLKENVVDASSQWDDIKALQVRKYNLKEGQTHTQIGLIAQEVEPISPGLVYESPDRDEDGNDLGTVTKSVNYSVLYMKAVKALQEAMERIETLEQRLNDAGIN